MVGRRSFPLGKAYFQGARLLLGRVSTSTIKVESNHLAKHVGWSKKWHSWDMDMELVAGFCPINGTACPYSTCPSSKKGYPSVLHPCYPSDVYETSWQTLRFFQFNVRETQWYTPEAQETTHFLHSFCSLYVVILLSYFFLWDWNRFRSGSASHCWSVCVVHRVLRCPMGRNRMK